MEELEAEKEAEVEPEIEVEADTDADVLVDGESSRARRDAQSMTSRLSLISLAVRR